MSNENENDVKKEVKKKPIVVIRSQNSSNQKV